MQIYVNYFKEANYSQRLGQNCSHAMSSEGNFQIIYEKNVVGNDNKIEITI